MLSVTRRAAPNISSIPISATASVSTPGVLSTGKPRSCAAAMSMWS